MVSFERKEEHGVRDDTKLGSIASTPQETVIPAWKEADNKSNAYRNSFAAQKLLRQIAFFIEFLGFLHSNPLTAGRKRLPIG